jgi:hypothetical protein
MTNTQTALLCVGSGLSRRYMMNTLQALALPNGAILQFRYRKDLISEALQKSLSENTLCGTPVLLGYVNCTESGRSSDDRCLIVPYREAVLRRSESRGIFFVFQLELSHLRLATDLEAFQRSLSLNSPRWQRGADGNYLIEPTGDPVLSGLWCQEVSGGLPPVRKTVEGWQAAVTELSKHKDFADQPYFYLVEGLFRREKGLPDGVEIKFCQGEYQLQPRSEYELRVLHFDPRASAHRGSPKVEILALQTPSPLFSMRSSPLLVIDSPYDLKTIHFGTSDTSALAYGSLCLQPRVEKPEEQIIPELFLPVTIRFDSVRHFRNGGILGFLLSIAQLVTVFSKGSLGNWHADALVAAFVVLLGFGTGFFVSLGMRKPL